jgi:serine/threonine-protein kinase PknK
LGLPAHPKIGVLPVVSYDARRRPVDEIDEITVQHEEASAIRTLLAEQDPAKADLACRWAQEWVDRLAERHRPQALLRARRLLVGCLAAAGRADEAKAVLVTIASQCAQIGSFRYLPDGGPYVAATLTALYQDQQNGHWRPEWPEVPADFLTSLVNSKVVHTI